MMQYSNRANDCQKLCKVKQKYVSYSKSNKKSKKIKIKLQFIAINPEHVVKILNRFPQCRQQG